jgi:hypothetical protein
MIGRLAIALLLLAGTLVAGAAAAPGDPERRQIRAADQARARQAILRLSDLPAGFRSFPHRNSQEGPPTCGRFRPDMSDLTITGEAGSPAFVRADGTSIFSASEFYKTAGQARASWSRVTKREALPCFAQRLERDSASSATRFDIRSYAQLRAPDLGDRSAKFRFTGIIESQAVRVRIWIDLLGVGRGRADASLVFITFRQPPSAALERSLIAKLAQRLGSGR